jgi:hypothetical protein
MGDSKNDTNKRNLSAMLGAQGLWAWRDLYRATHLL